MIFGVYDYMYIVAFVAQVSDMAHGPLVNRNCSGKRMFSKALSRGTKVYMVHKE